jgi:hypothetical protein
MKRFKLPTVPAIVAICLLAVVFNSQAQKRDSIYFTQIGKEAKIYSKTDTMKEETRTHKTPGKSIQGNNEVFIGVKSVMNTKTGENNVGFGETQMFSSFYIKELECYIDFTKIVEISTLKQMPVIELKTGFNTVPNGYFESENYRKQGQFYFVITYQLKTPVKHWVNLPKNESEKIYSNMLSIWRQSLNNR